jgi:hypothetical protein
MDDVLDQIDQTFTREGLEELATRHKIALPGGWTKMAFDRKKRALATAVAKAGRPSVLSKLASAVATTVSEFGKNLRAANDTIDSAFRTEATMPKDKNWKRRKHPDRMIRIMAGRKEADDPVPMTRQVARANKRRNDKRMLANLKTDAARSSHRGGPAAVTMRDVEVVQQGLRERIEQSA